MIPVILTSILFGGGHASGYSPWRATGPFGGEAEIVRTLPKVRDFVIAGSHNGLLFTSTNGGASWNNLFFPAQFAGVLHALEGDPRTMGTWFAGTESTNSWISGVYKTTDAGGSWTLLPATKGLAVWSLAMWPANPDWLAAGTSTGVYLSKDAGATWTHISKDGDPELRPVVSLAFHPSDGNTIFAGTTHLPWKTTNGGKDWESIHEGMLDDSDVFSIQVDPAKPSRVFASACSGVYGSANGAAKWSKLETPAGTFRTYFVAIDPKHPETVFAGTTGGLLKSASGGRGWRKVSPEAVKSIAFDPFVAGRIFFASTTGGLLISRDGGDTVRESNVGFTNRNFTSLTGAGPELYASSVFETGSGGVYRTDNLGLRWVHTGEPSTDQLLAVAADPAEAKVLYAAGYHTLLESRDGGITWKAASGPPGAQVSSLLAVAGGSGTTLLAGTGQGVFRRGANQIWEQTSSQSVGQLSRSGANRIVAFGSQGAMVSGDNGATWKSCGQPQTAATWYGLAFDAGSPQIALSATPSGLYRSTNGCQSWTPVRRGLDSQTVSLVVFHPARAGEAYLSQGGKVFRSTDGGQQWSPLDEGAAGNSGPSSLFVLPAAPDRLFALFPRRGVFSTSISFKETSLQ